MVIGASRLKVRRTTTRQGSSDGTPNRAASCAVGSLVVILLWLYYSAQIFLLGAEFTWVYANTFGSRRQEVALSVKDAPGPRI